MYCFITYIFVTIIIITKVQVKIQLRRVSNIKTKKQTAEIVRLLAQCYPIPKDGLEYEYPWRLMVAVRLSAQCTDVRVNEVTKILFKKYPALTDLAKATPTQIEAIVKPCGLGKSKARDIHAACNMLLEKYGGELPSTMEELLSIPGVGRKSANLILGDIFGQPAIVADTHCIRISNRIGFVKSKDPLKVEMALRKVVAPEDGNDFCHRLVMHGRAVCTARKALCESCNLAPLCNEGLRWAKAQNYTT